MIMNTIILFITIFLQDVKNDILSMSIKRTGFGEFSVNTHINNGYKYMAVNPSTAMTTFQSCW